MVGIRQLTDLAGLVDLVPDAVVLVDGAGTIRLANAATQALFGWAPEALVGQPVEILVPAAMRGAHARHRTRFAEGPEVRPMGTVDGLVGLHRDGREIPIDIRLGPTRVGDEQMVTAVVRDMTQARAQQAQLQRHARDLQRLNAALEASLQQVEEQNAALAASMARQNLVLGVAAHDLRNPLAAIRSFAEILHDGLLGRLEPRQVGFVQRIVRSTDYMLALVEDLVDLAAIESGQLRLQLEPTDLARITVEALAVERIVAERKGMSLELHEAPAPVLADQRKMEQVVHNLVGNALKYAPGGSAVRVEVGARDGRAALEVRDQGPGISEETRARLFEPFARGEARSTGGEPSTGLGLAIVRRIVLGHGGAIEVDSAPGAGATFRVVLPLAP